MNGDFSTKVTCIFIIWEHSPLFKWIGSLENTTTVPLNNKSTNLRIYRRNFDKMLKICFFEVYA